MGRKRDAEAKRLGLSDKHGFDGVGAAIHAIGVAGERAVANYMRMTGWEPSLNTFRREADVGGYEVRTRRYDHYDLIVRDNDDDDAAFILVTGLPPNMTIRGFIRGADAKQDEWRKAYGNRPAAYFIPQGALEDPGGLPRGPALRESEKASVCGYESHRPSDWAWPDDEGWTCAVCHPPPALGAEWGVVDPAHRAVVGGHLRLRDRSVWDAE